MKANQFYILLLLLLTSCSAPLATDLPPIATPIMTVTLSLQPTVTRILPTPTSLTNHVESEVVAFILDSLCKEYLTADAYYKESFPTESLNWLIVWVSAKQEVESNNRPDFLEANQPIKVWSLTSGTLSELIDQQAALKKYDQQEEQIIELEENHQYPDRETMKSWWSEYFKFGIFFTSTDGQIAKVFIDTQCGPLCGTAYVDILQRDVSGKWKRISHEVAGYH